jgi:hypothetical protein
MQFLIGLFAGSSTEFDTRKKLSHIAVPESEFGTNYGPLQLSRNVMTATPARDECVGEARAGCNEMLPVREGALELAANWNTASLLFIHSLLTVRRQSRHNPIPGPCGV